ncbi:MAG: HD-GYP domain-containing protein [Candidatus Caldatribacterium sp.]|nr:HD-GYP domain-containing protein [Candidatus Caldatribacterium sp.]
MERAKKRAFFFVYLGCVVGFGAIVFVLSFAGLSYSPSILSLFCVFTTLTLVAELLPVYLQPQTAISVSFAPLYAVILLSSPHLASFVAFVAAFLGTLRSGWHKGLFNGSQYAISAFLSGLVFERLGGYGFHWEEPGFYLAVGASIGTFFLCNLLLVLGVVSLSTSTPFSVIWKQSVNGILLQYFALFPFSLLLYFVYTYVGYVGIALFFLPLLVARYSFKLFVDTKRMHLELLRALTAAVDAKDPYTRGHSARVAKLALRIADHLRLSGKQKEIVEYAAILHDVGKIGITDVILSKPGRLSPEEYRVVQEHPLIGYRIVKDVNFLHQVAEVILSHHERCNGRGYPHGKCKEEIPLEARIVAVADVFDALTSERPYRRAYTVEEALTIMENEEEGHFDPEVLAVLRNIVHSGEWSYDAC